MNNRMVSVEIVSKGDSYYIYKDGYTSPTTDSIGFIQQLRDLCATAPYGYGSAEMWVYDPNRSNTNTVDVNASLFSKYFKSI